VISEAHERLRLLRELGAGESEIKELLAYTANPYQELELPTGGLPPEPQLKSWMDILDSAKRDGVVKSLARRFPQFLFPIEKGISQSERYRAATRRGEFDRNATVFVLGLEKPGCLELRIEELPVGLTPVLIAATRQDFVRLVQALACRNEPEVVPDSMGACLVKGLADWGRLDGRKQELQHRLGREPEPEEWSHEVAALAGQKELWQARFILLSRGPYSAVPAEAVGLSREEWEACSVALRLAHEGLHYLTLRLCGEIRSNLLDELVADAAGMVHAFGRYSVPLALRFLGIGPDGELLPGARLALYRGEPAVSDQGLRVLARLAVQAAAELDRCLSSVDWKRMPSSVQAELWVAILRQDLLGWLNGGLRFPANWGEKTEPSR
jgi:hypothetical protein